MPEANFENRTLAVMDNLRFLLSLDDACIDLIAMDPPFGKMLYVEKRSLVPLGRAQKWAVNEMRRHAGHGGRL